MAIQFNSIQQNAQGETATQRTPSGTQQRLTAATQARPGPAHDEPPAQTHTRTFFHITPTGGARRHPKRHHDTNGRHQFHSARPDYQSSSAHASDSCARQRIDSSRALGSRHRLSPSFTSVACCSGAGNAAATGDRLAGAVRRRPAHAATRRHMSVACGWSTDRSAPFLGSARPGKQRACCRGDALAAPRPPATGWRARCGGGRRTAATRRHMGRGCGQRKLRATLHASRRPLFGWLNSYLSGRCVAVVRHRRVDGPPLNARRRDGRRAKLRVLRASRVGTTL